VADVFISYSQQDRVIARGLADFLVARDYDVWWDPALVSGENYRDKIKHELAGAKAAIVIWTPNSVESDWVIDEAEVAKKSGKLVPTKIEDLDYLAIPMGFRGLHTDLVTEFERIFKALDDHGVTPSQPPTVPKPDPIVTAKGLDPDAVGRAEQFAFAHWDVIKDSQDPAAFGTFIGNFPSSTFAALARIKLGKMAAEHWPRLVGSEDIRELEWFAKSFPDDPNAAEARRRIEVLASRGEEAASWNRIKDRDEIEAFEEHLRRFPGGANVTAAHARLNALRRDKAAADYWRSLTGSTQPDAYKQFLTTYPDSRFAPQAQSRLLEILRAREEADWSKVTDARHPVPLLRFLKAHPDGARARAACELLAALPRTIEDEAWAEIKDADQSILFQAFVAAMPASRHAKAARAKLKTLGAARPLPALRAGAGAAPPSGVPQPSVTPWQRTARRNVFWAIAVLSAVPVLPLSGQAATIWSPATVSNNLPIAIACLVFGALWLYAVGPRVYAGAAGAHQQRTLLFHVIGTMGILTWMASTQFFSDLNRSYSSNSSVYNYRDLSVILGGCALGVLVVALIALGSRSKLLRLAYYGLVFAVGLFSVLAFYNDFNFRRYFVSSGLEVWGGGGLMVMVAVALVAKVTGRHAAVKSAE
jgi:hypothetical protein